MKEGKKRSRKVCIKRFDKIRGGTVLTACGWIPSSVISRITSREPAGSPACLLYTDTGTRGENELEGVRELEGVSLSERESRSERERERE